MTTINYHLNVISILLIWWTELLGERLSLAKVDKKNKNKKKYQIIIIRQIYSLLNT